MRRFIKCAFFFEKIRHLTNPVLTGMCTGTPPVSFYR
jgi:hypothetical protein